MKKHVLALRWCPARQCQCIVTAFSAALAGRQAESYGSVDDGTQPLLSFSPVPNSLWEGVRRPQIQSSKMESVEPGEHLFQTQ